MYCAHSFVNVTIYHVAYRILGFHHHLVLLGSMKVYSENTEMSK